MRPRKTPLVVRDELGATPRSPITGSMDFSELHAVSNLSLYFQGAGQGAKTPRLTRGVTNVIYHQAFSTNKS